MEVSKPTSVNVMFWVLEELLSRFDMYEVIHTIRNKKQHDNKSHCLIFDTFFMSNIICENCVFVNTKRVVKNEK